jgi:hypothetical protein
MNRATRMMGHSLILRTSPGRRPPNLGLSVSPCLESVATWFAGITSVTAATASSRATAAAQSDLLPSGAVTSTMGMRSVRRARSSSAAGAFFLPFLTFAARGPNRRDRVPHKRKRNLRSRAMGLSSGAMLYRIPFVISECFRRARYSQRGGAAIRPASASVFPNASLCDRSYGTMSSMSTRLVNLIKRILMLRVVARSRAAGSMLASRAKSAAINGA